MYEEIRSQQEHVFKPRSFCNRRDRFVKGVWSHGVRAREGSRETVSWTPAPPSVAALTFGAPFTFTLRGPTS